MLALAIMLVNAYHLSQADFSSLTAAAIENLDTGDHATASTTETTTNSVLPKGIPLIYGKELGISYDDVSVNNPNKADTTIKKLGALDEQISLTPPQQQRYITILYTLEKGISCEYCCGAPAIITSKGDPACGCAHSYAMRGIAKYLITRHGTEYTDRQILEEAGKWKTLFFPGQMQLKAQVLQQQGIEINYINLASNKYRGIEQGKSAGGMIGGC